MDYQISEKIQNIFDKVTSTSEVHAAVEYIRENHLNSMKEHKEFVLCESPTFFEDARAKLYAERLAEAGLEDIKIEPYKDVWGIRKGTGGGPTILVEAHMDTVFPFGSVKEIIDEDGVMHAPGVTDDTRGMTTVLAVLRAMNRFGIKTKGDIIFAGTAREEGMGSLGGMKDLLTKGPKVDASVSVDGADTEEITCEATGYKTYEVNFFGIGGHAWGDFAKMANPLHAAARAVAKIAELSVPSDPKTSFCVSNFHAGNDAGVHAIVPKATIKYNIRSNSQEELDKLDKRVFDAIREACEEETAKWSQDTITWDIKQFCDVPAGKQDHHAPLIEAAVACARYYTPEERKAAVNIPEGGCVNGNMAIGAGIPCVTLGGGTLNCCVHSLEESFPYKKAYALPQNVLTLLCMAAGLDGVSDSVLR